MCGHRQVAAGLMPVVAGLRRAAAIPGTVADVEQGEERPALRLEHDLRVRAPGTDSTVHKFKRTFWRI